MKLPEVSTEATALLQGLCKHLIAANVSITDRTPRKAHCLLKVVTADLGYGILLHVLQHRPRKSRKTEAKLDDNRQCKMPNNYFEVHVPWKMHEEESYQNSRYCGSGPEILWSSRNEAHNRNGQIGRRLHMSKGGNLIRHSGMTKACFLSSIFFVCNQISTRVITRGCELSQPRNFMHTMSSGFSCSTRSRWISFSMASRMANLHACTRRWESDQQKLEKKQEYE